MTDVQEQPRLNAPQSESKWIETWCSIGNSNPWIKEAWDPGFGNDSFVEMRSIDELIAYIDNGNWCLGMSLVYKDLVLINQINGGDEWMACRRDVQFESMSMRRILHGDGGRTEIESWVNRVLSPDVSDEQLVRFDY